MRGFKGPCGFRITQEAYIVIVLTDSLLTFAILMT